MKEIDVRGLSCPEPVLIVMAVLSDAAHTRDNLLKLAHEYHREASVEMRGKDYVITIS